MKIWDEKNSAAADALNMSPTAAVRFRCELAAKIASGAVACPGLRINDAEIVSWSLRLADAIIAAATAEDAKIEDQ